MNTIVSKDLLTNLFTYLHDREVVRDSDAMTMMAMMKEVDRVEIIGKKFKFFKADGKYHHSLWDYICRIPNLSELLASVAKYLTNQEGYLVYSLGKHIEYVYSRSNSCMRNNPKNTVSLYAENPDVVGCLSLYREDNINTGLAYYSSKALIWHGSDGETFMDRQYEEIYALHVATFSVANDQPLVVYLPGDSVSRISDYKPHYLWLNDVFINGKYSKQHSVSLSFNSTHGMPYFDSLCTLDDIEYDEEADKGVLRIRWERSGKANLQSTNWTPIRIYSSEAVAYDFDSREPVSQSELEDDYVIISTSYYGTFKGLPYALHRDDADYVESRDDYYHRDDIIWCERGDCCYLADDCQLAIDDYYYPKDELIELYDGQYAHEDDGNVVMLYDGDHAHVDFHDVGIIDCGGNEGEGYLYGDREIVELYDGMTCHKDDAVELIDGSYALEYDAVELWDGGYAIDTVKTYNNLVVPAETAIETITGLFVDKKANEDEYEHCERFDVYFIPSIDKEMEAVFVLYGQMKIDFGEVA